MFKILLILSTIACIYGASSDTNNKKPLRWGIVSAGKICHDFVNALSTLPKTDHKIVAVGARDIEKAKKFAEEFNIPNAYAGYLPIAQNPNIDVVYIGTINKKHFEDALLMLSHNKSVLCEKPMTLNYKQTKKLVDLAREKKLFLSEGIWSRAFPIYKDMMEIIESGKIGKVKHIYANIGGYIPETGKLFVKSLGGSSILTVGIYPLQLQQLIFKEKPVNVTAVGRLNNDGVDTGVSAILGYTDGRTSLIQTEYSSNMDNTAVIYGENGRILVPDFVHPSKLEVINDDEVKDTKERPLPEVRKPCNYGGCGGFAYEAEQVRKCLDKGLTENPLITLNESLELAELMDELRRIVGVTYPEDLE